MSVHSIMAPAEGLPMCREACIRHRRGRTGRPEFDLRSGPGRHADTVEVVVRIDNVTLWSANRTLDPRARGSLSADTDGVE